MAGGTHNLRCGRLARMAQRFTQEPAVAAAETVDGVYKLHESVARICPLQPIGRGIITDACGEPDI